MHTRSRWDEIHTRREVAEHALRVHEAADPEKLTAREPDPLERLRWARWLAAEVQQMQEAAIIDARNERRTWDEIGEVYGLSRQAAHNRYGHLTKKHG